MNASTTTRCTGGLGLKDVQALDPMLDVSTVNSVLHSLTVSPIPYSGLQNTSLWMESRFVGGEDSVWLVGTHIFYYGKSELCI